MAEKQKCEDVRVPFGKFGGKTLGDESANTVGKCRIRSGCREPAISGRRGRGLCARHFRVRQMRECARRSRKTVPSATEIDLMLASLIEFRCPNCNRVMNWLRRDGRDSVITLQHDNDGKLRLICFSCNARHRDYGDMIYGLSQNERRCSRCRLILPIACFPSDFTSRVWKNRKAYCRGCCNAYHREWSARNRDKLREKNRKYQKVYSERRRLRRIEVKAMDN